METRFSEIEAKWASRISTVLLALVLAFAGLAIIGWATGNPVLSNLGLGTARTSVPTALALAALAAASLLRNGRSEDDSMVRYVVMPVGLIIAIAAFLVHVRYALGMPLPGQVFGPAFGEVSPVTAAMCFLAALAIGLPKRFAAAAVGLLTIGAVVVDIHLVGYLFDVELGHRVLPFSSLALTTSFAFASLLFALLLQRPGTSWTQFLFWRGRIGAVVRTFLPAVVLVPLVLGEVANFAVDWGWLGPKFAFSILTVATTALLGGLVCVVVLRFARADDDLATAYDRLDESTRILEAAAVSADLAAFTRRFDPESGRIATRWTSGAQRIFGLTDNGDEIRTFEIGRFVHPEDRAILERIEADIPDQIRNPARVGGTPVVHTFRIVRPDGTERWVQKLTHVVRDPSGERNEAIGIIQDVTDARKMEAQLFQAQKMETIGNLTGGMAHDVNNVLGIVVGNIDLLASRLTEPDDRALAREILDAALKGSELMRSLLAFARRQPLRPEPLEVNALVADMTKLMRRTLGEKIEIKMDLADDLALAIADSAQLEAAIANLANNARDAMPDGGTLHIVTANSRLDAEYADLHADVTPGDYAMIEISDDGTGMPPEVVQRIFEPFFTTKTGRGTGLGLSMVYGFLKQLGGHINVYSETGIGTTFRLYLPRADAEPAANDVIAHGSADPHAARGTVLAVEDNAAMRRVVVRQLREFGYEVFEAASAAAALELLQRQRMDILFSDIVMPGDMDGIDLAHRAREMYPDLRVVLTSGFPEAAINGRGKGLGQFRLLNKPYRRDQLAEALQGG